MRWQVLAGALAVGLLAVVSVSATPIDFATDPGMSSNWTQYYFYNAYGRPNVTSDWNAAGQNLSLTCTTEEGLGGLYRNGDVRSATDGVTVTYSNYMANTPADASNWNCAGLVVATSRQPGIFDNPAGWYGVYFQEEWNAAAAAPRYRFSAGKGLWTTLGTILLDSVPSTMKLDIVRDGTAWVFKANDVEIARDLAGIDPAAAPYYMIYWGGGGTDTMSVSADNYGIISVPEPTSLVLLSAGLLGLVCYAWRKR